MALDVNERAWNLYQQIQAQRATIKTYEEALSFVKVRQFSTPELVEPIALKLWEISERMRGDMNPSF